MRSRNEKIVKSPAEWRRQNQVKKIRIVMTAVVVMLLLSVAAGAALAWYQIRSAAEENRRQLLQNRQPVSSLAQGLPVYDDSFNLVLAGPNRPLPDGYRPQIESYGGVSVDGRILPALRKMMGDAESAGCPLTPAAGYVDAEKQEALFRAEAEKLMRDQKLSQVVAESRAQSAVGKGNRCDAQTGLSVVFSAGGKDFGSTPQYRWLTRNCVSYGFIQRYPPEKSAKTGMEGDAARFRYVGEDNAVKMRELSMCLEEYVSYLGVRETG